MINTPNGAIFQMQSVTSLSTSGQNAWGISFTPQTKLDPSVSMIGQINTATIAPENGMAVIRGVVGVHAIRKPTRNVAARDGAMPPPDSVLLMRAAW